MSSNNCLDHKGEMLHRQVHPSFLSDGVVSSQAFTPFPKDEGGLSVDRDSIANAEESYRHHTVDKSLESAATFSVTVGECTQLGLPVCADPVMEAPENAAHCLIEFRNMSANQMKKVGKKLRDHAEVRGPTHTPPNH